MKHNTYISSHSWDRHFKHIEIEDNIHAKFQLGYYRPPRYGDFVKGKYKSIVILFLEERRADTKIEFAQKRIIESPTRYEDFIIPGVCPPHWGVYWTDNPDYGEDTLKNY